MRKNLIVFVIASAIAIKAKSQSVDEIVDRYRAVTGHLMTLDTLSLYLEGDMCYQKLCFPARMYIKPPKAMHLELTFQGLKFYMVGNDSLRWAYDPINNTNKITRLSDETTVSESDATMNFLNEDLYYHKERKVKLKLLKKEKLDSLETYVISMQSGDGQKSTVYINTQSYLINKIVDKNGTNQFYDYSITPQMIFPRLIMQKGTKNTMEMRLRKILTHQKFDNSLFIIPDSAFAYKNENQALLEKAASFSDAGEYDSAINIYSLVLKRDAKSEGIYNLRGLAFLNAGNYYEAIGDFSHAIDINPSNAILFHNRGLAKYNLNDFDNALKDYNAAIKLAPDLGINYEKRGLVYFNQERYEDAVHEFDVVLAKDPKDGKNYFNRGVSRAQLEQYTQAISDYRKSEASGYHDASLFNYRGVSHYHLQEYDTALQYFDKAISIDNSVAQYIENAGRALYELGEYEKAEERFELYLKQAPDNASVINLVALCRYFQEDFKGAIKYFTRAIEKNPNEATYFDNRADAKEQIEDFQGAIEDYNKSVALYPNDPAVFYKRGLLKIRTSKKIEGCLDLGTANEMKYEEAKAAILQHCN